MESKKGRERPVPSSSPLKRTASAYTMSQMSSTIIADSHSSLTSLWASLVAPRASSLSFHIALTVATGRVTMALWEGAPSEGACWPDPTINIEGGSR